MSGTLVVKEVFQTLQGEGPLAGEPCVFVRLAGCNLRCHFCDTDFRDGRATRVRSLVERIQAMLPLGGRPLCVITGGEPLAQEIGPLVSTLLGHKCRVQVETAGTLWVDLPESPDLEIVCSPKTVDVHPMIRRRATAWKYLHRAVDAVDTDGLPIMVTQDKRVEGGGAPVDEPPAALAKPRPHTPVFIQPVDEGDEAANRRNLDSAVSVCLRHGHRLCLQQHKIIGLP